MKDGRIDLRIGPLHAEWEAACFARNERPAVGALRLIKQDLAARRAGGVKTDPKTYKPIPGDEEKKLMRVGQLHVRFSTSELEAIKTEAARTTFHNPQAWIVAAVRGTLTRSPQFSQGELDVLTESTRQLAAIGRNLNQLVRAINTSPVELARVGAEEIETVREAIKTELRNIGALVSASADRWPLVPLETP
jgi:hypothetical protein